jgi:transcriptional regulator with XRE-family HTH domain
MATLTMGQAAKETGVSKATLSKALKNGRLSYVAKTTAGYEIDPAELFRVFPPKPSTSVEGERSETHREHLLLDDAHRREVQLLREQLDEVRTDRDAWREQAQRLALAAPETVAAPVPKRSIWPWGHRGE